MGACCVSGCIRVHVPGMKLEDLGAEFALNVKEQTSAVPIFENEVIAHTQKQAPASLKQGMSMAFANSQATPQDFLPLASCRATGSVLQYFDAQEVSREVSPLHQPGRAITLGPCETRNWGLPTQRHPFPIRNLNGAIDEFAIYDDVLSPSELHTLFDQGKPE